MKTHVHLSKSYFGIGKCTDPSLSKSYCCTGGDYPTAHNGVEGYCKRTYLLEIEEVEG